VNGIADTFWAREQAKTRTLGRRKHAAAGSYAKTPTRNIGVWGTRPTFRARLSANGPG